MNAVDIVISEKSDALLQDSGDVGRALKDGRIEFANFQVARRYHNGIEIAVRDCQLGSQFIRETPNGRNELERSGSVIAQLSKLRLQYSFKQGAKD